MANRILLILALLALSFAGPARAGDWLVRDGASPDAPRLAAQAGLEHVRTWRHLPWSLYRTSTPDPGAAKQPGARPTADPGLAAAARLSAAGVSIVPDTTVRLTASPDDTQFASQSYLASPSPDADMFFREGWDTQTSTGDATVAIIDSGVTSTHPDLIDNLWANDAELNGTPGVDDDGNGYIDDVNGWNTVDNNGDVTDTYSQFHGTRVAGLIGAVGNNAEGVAGAAWDTNLMILRAFPDNMTSTSFIIDSIDYILGFPEVRVVNASWGDTVPSIPLQEAIEALNDNGIVLVAAAGNGSENLDTTPFYPASHPIPNIISVMSVDLSGAPYPTSNFGPGVTVAAVGAGLFSTNNSGGYSGVDPGTSFATPLVSGAVLLYRARNPSLAPPEVVSHVLQTSRRTTPLPPSIVQGGLLNFGDLITFSTAVPNAARSWALFQ